PTFLIEPRITRRDHRVSAAAASGYRGDQSVKETVSPHAKLEYAKQLISTGAEDFSCQTLQICHDYADSLTEVRAAIGNRGCNEVDEVDRKAAAWWSGLRPLLYPTCVDAAFSGYKISAQLSAVIGHPTLMG